jgi:putative transposase
MCRVVQVPRSGFYAWLHKPLSDRALEDQRLLTLIRDSYAASGGVYGSPRMFLDLREAGESCGKHRVARGCLVIWRQWLQRIRVSTLAERPDPITRRQDAPRSNRWLIPQASSDTSAQTRRRW